MNIQSIILLAIGYFIIFYLLLRIKRSRRFVVILVLLLPMIFFSVRWAGYRGNWTELVIGFSLGLIGIVIWWSAIGRRLPAPKDSIRVWSEDEPF